MGFNTNMEDKLEFSQIVLRFIRDILSISLHELRNQSYEVISTGSQTTKFQEDSRISYCQAIENLAYILAPYFDTRAQKVYDECMPVITALNIKVKELLPEEYKEICGLMELKNNTKDFAIYEKLNYAKKLFLEMNLLLKRVDYLKGAIYGESKDEVAVIEDEEEDEE